MEHSEEKAAEDEVKKNCPLEKASIWSRLCFWWLVPLLRTGSKKPIEAEDLWDIPGSSESSLLGDRFQDSWERNAITTKTRYPLAKTIFQTIGYRFYMMAILLTFQNSIMRQSQSVLLVYFLRNLRNHGIEFSTGLYGLGLVLTNFLFTFGNRPIIFELSRVGMDIRIACSNLIYRRCLRLSKEALAETSVGKIVNLLSNDVSRFNDCFRWMTYLLTAPFSIIVGTVLVWWMLGVTALVGFVVLALTLVIQSYMGNLIGKRLTKIASKTDARVNVINEILKAIKIIKMYAWEASMSESVKEARDSEMKGFNFVNNLQALLLTLHQCCDKIVILSMLAAYVWTGHHVSAEEVFFAVKTFTHIQSDVLLFSSAIVTAKKTAVTIARIQTFLLLADCDSPGLSLSPDTPCEYGLHMEGVSSSWTEVQGTPSKHVLSNGTIRRPAKIGYVSQEPWIFSGTIEENILLGQPMDEQRFQEVISCCALETDLSTFPAGRKTFIGDRGITLSGGQKARVSLARAIYQDADLYLLDDPLSSVDTRVGKHIFEECILRQLKENC
ncbi:unnamed protein product [Cyprideis torosa]|uniref:Uncharacterized protein n=1 Tax=Cyprideis torosa TaxID=163714 RepID=A0A7R8WES5_9CRUS|nr:unnamed protein product [Cyprideis torosa]CAG0891058.1 unnamed protein product [Cyprideis torosa]